MTVILQDPGGPVVTGPDFDNCKVLDDTLQLSWRVDDVNAQVRFQLCGCTARYMLHNLKDLTCS